MRRSRSIVRTIRGRKISRKRRSSKSRKRRSSKSRRPTRNRHATRRMKGGGSCREWSLVRAIENAKDASHTVNSDMMKRDTTARTTTWNPCYATSKRKSGRTEGEGGKFYDVQEDNNYTSEEDPYVKCCKEDEYDY